MDPPSLLNLNHSIDLHCIANDWTSFYMIQVSIVNSGDFEFHIPYIPSRQLHVQSQQ